MTQLIFSEQQIVEKTTAKKHASITSSCLLRIATEKVTISIERLRHQTLDTKLIKTNHFLMSH